MFKNYLYSFKFVEVVDAYEFIFMYGRCDVILLIDTKVNYKNLLKIFLQLLNPN